MRKIFLVFFLVIAYFQLGLAAEVQQLELSYSESLERSIHHSPQLAASRLEALATTERAASVKAQKLPKLSLEGTTRYVTEVPNLPVTTEREIAFGDNESYSIGPVIRWTLWDSGALTNVLKSFKALSDGKESQVKIIQRQIHLWASVAYFQVYMAAESTRLLADSLKLAQIQYNDITRQKSIGAASKTDELQASQEVLKYKLQLKQAQTELAEHLEDLLSLMGQENSYDTSRPLDSKTDYANLEKPTLILKLDSLDYLFEVLKIENPRELEINHPQLQFFKQQAEAESWLAQSANTEHWPKIQLYAKSSYDYPNGPNLETIQQNMIGLNLTWPLFEGGRITHEIAERKKLAHAAEKRKEQAYQDLLRDWRKGQDRLTSLREQRKLSQLSAQKAREAARLIYTSYKNGRTNFLEVESANLRALEAQAQAARLDAQFLIQIAVLDSLAKEKP